MSEDASLMVGALLIVVFSVLGIVRFVRTMNAKGAEMDAARRRARSLSRPSSRPRTRPQTPQDRERPQTPTPRTLEDALRLADDRPPTPEMRYASVEDDEGPGTSPVHADEAPGAPLPSPEPRTEEEPPYIDPDVSEAAEAPRATSSARRAPTSLSSEYVPVSLYESGTSVYTPRSEGGRAGTTSDEAGSPTKAGPAGTDDAGTGGAAPTGGEASPGPR